MLEGDPPEEVGLRYLSVAYHLRKTLDDAMTASGSSLARTKILQVLQRTGPAQQVLLATELDLAPRTVTQAIEAMELDGLVRRKPDPTDGRAKLVTLTDTGAEALTASTAVGEAVLRRAFQGLDGGQLTALDEILRLIEVG